MGNAHTKPHPRPRNKKQVHWKAADRPAPPGRPHLSPDGDLPELITLAWQPPVRDGGSPITGYLVEHHRTGSPHWLRTSPLLVPFPELSLGGLEPGWRYQFRVRAENAVGLSDSSQVSEPLTVGLQKHSVTAPRFTDELKDITTLENDKIEFEVHFVGQPVPKICWFKDGFEIFSSRRTRILTEGDRSMLTFHQSALADEGEIKCTATNKAGHASTKARLNLEAPPTIRLPRQYEDGLLFEIGEVIRLKVSVAGKPTPLIFWSHNGETIQNNDRYEVEYLDKSSILKINEATRTDRGEYQIKAVNKIGEDLASFLVTITDKPSPPGKARVVMTLGRSVTLSWSTPDDDGGCKIGNYIVEYYRLGWNVWLKAATSRQLSTILGDLIEGSEYKFRVKAESPYGVSDPSEESDVIFIPDAKRGITSPQIRSRSQPKDLIEAVPVATKRRKNQPRSQSSTGKIVIAEETPRRPERTKMKTPEASPLPIRKMSGGLLDRSSLARELAYGSPEIKMMKIGDNIVINTIQNGNVDGMVTKIEDLSLVSPKEKSEGMEETSEFMLVLYPESDRGNRRTSLDFDFTEYDIPPPLSLSAPELGAEPPIFANLKTSASSTELLHERAMMRFNEAAKLEEEMDEERRTRRRKFSYDGTHIIDIPKIQINSQDEDELIGLERRSSMRRRSAGGIVQQQLMWAQRRWSLKSNLEGDGKDLTRESEEIEFEKVRERMKLHGQSSLEKRSIEIVDEEKWLEEYEESLSESDTESDDEERDLAITLPSKISDEDEDTYHPKTVSDEPFQILTKRNKLPDPNFIPKPILKRTEEKNDMKEHKIRSHSPMPKFQQEIATRERSKSLAYTPKMNKLFQRSTSLKEEPHLEEIKPQAKKPVGQNVSAVATLGAITAASIIIPGQLLQKKKDEEESKVVVDHYTDIVKSYGHKKVAPPSWKIKEDRQIASPIEQQENKPVTYQQPKKELIIQTVEPLKKAEPHQKGPSPVQTTNRSSSPIQMLKRSPSPSSNRSSPVQQRGRSSTQNQRKKWNRSKTPSKSPSRLENWAGRRRKTSPSPIKSKSPSPIPLARPKAPMLREIMTQTSIGLEMGPAIDRRKSVASGRNEELLFKAEVKVRSFVDYVTDLAMFFLACWLYLFSNELLAIPVLLIMVYRQLKDEVEKRIPKWILRRMKKKK